jgi:fibro-slime domain-containing protein
LLSLSIGYNLREEVVMRIHIVYGVIASLSALLLFSCATGASRKIDDKPGSTAGSGSRANIDAGGSGEDPQQDAGVDELSKQPATTNCGDGILTPDEACDDGNTKDGDGCLGNCRGVERGYSCPTQGELCRRIARCGDGVAVLPEQCDDGNKVAGDGCSDTCHVELGFKCSGSPSKCTPATCGDGKVEGTESCEDGNNMPYDGCSTDCRNEPKCTSDGCQSKCGDGILLPPELCDDGNNTDGDGCSADCKAEKGFVCRQPDLGTKMVVPMVLRDFRYQNPADFQPGATGRQAAKTGMVENTLDKDGKPVYTGISDAFVKSKDTFAQWYRDVNGVNHTTPSKIVLWNDGKGAYTNRYGANGEQFEKTKTAYYCGNVGTEQTDSDGNPIPCTSKQASETDCSKAIAAGLVVRDCKVNNNNYVATIVTAKVDGNPLFFPVDNDNFTPAGERSAAQLPGRTTGTADDDTWYSESWDWEGGKPLHNFSFTSEVRYWFQYDASKSYTLEFIGDDDVWVFINGKLAVDLGGIHTPVKGSVTLDASSAGTFGIKNGNVYQIAVFQAERQVSSSSYRLTLTGFSDAPSECNPICGDGVLALGEECDDGVNAGGYGKCGPNCQLGAYCGDGIVQKDQGEDCDDGVNAGQPCPSGCRIIVIY